MAIHNYLDKTGLSQLWSKAKAAFLSKPSGGTTGQVLTKTDDGEEWQDASGGASIDENGAIGDWQIPTTKTQVNAILSGDSGIELSFNSFSTIQKGTENNLYLKYDTEGFGTFSLPNGNYCSLYAERYASGQWYTRFCCAITTPDGVTTKHTSNSFTTIESAYDFYGAFCVPKVDNSSFPVTAYVIYGIPQLNSSWPNIIYKAIVTITADNVVSISYDYTLTYNNSIHNYHDAGASTKDCACLEDGSRLFLLGNLYDTSSAASADSYGVIHKITTEGILSNGATNKLYQWNTSSGNQYTGRNTGNTCYFEYQITVDQCFLVTVNVSNLSFTSASKDSSSLPSNYISNYYSTIKTLNPSTGVEKTNTYSGTSSPSVSSSTKLFKFIFSDGVTVPNKDEVVFTLSIDDLNDVYILGDTSASLNCFIRNPVGFCVPTQKISNSVLSNFTVSSMARGGGKIYEDANSQTWSVLTISETSPVSIMTISKSN